MTRQSGVSEYLAAALQIKPLVGIEVRAPVINLALQQNSEADSTAVTMPLILANLTVCY